VQLIQELEGRFDSDYGDFVELLGRMRDYIKRGIMNGTACPNRRLLEAERELRAC